jgi:hypothetical protein
MLIRLVRLVPVAMIVWSSCAGLTATSSQRSAPNTSAPIVTFFADDFWLNLHHFLYVLGRAENKTPDSGRDGVNQAPLDQDRGLATLSTSDQQIWRESVTAYAAGLSKRDAISSRDFVELTGALANARDTIRLEALAPALPATAVAILNRAAPVYRKTWWPDHHRANQQWVAAMQPLVDTHGAAILAFITRIYALPWLEDGYPVHLSGYTNWAGAYSTDGPVLMIASLDKGNGGEDGLEIVFHESMHQWDDAMLATLQKIGTALGKKVPPSLTHALIWMTAGEAIRRVLPDHVPIAERGIWQRGDYPTVKPILDATWLPYLQGKGTRDEALTGVMKLAGR